MDANGIEPKETVSASRRLARKDAAELAREASRVIVAKGKNVREFTGSAKSAAECIEAMLGPTGNLRAPTLKVGKTILVGFDQGAYERTLL